MVSLICPEESGLVSLFRRESGQPSAHGLEGFDLTSLSDPRRNGGGPGSLSRRDRRQAHFLWFRAKLFLNQAKDDKVMRQSAPAVFSRADLDA